MRALWIHRGADPDFVRIKAYGIDSLYFDMFDPKVTLESMQNLSDQGYRVGVYMASNWSEFYGKDPAGIAKVVNDRLKAVFRRKLANEFPRVQFDMEEHDPDKILATITEFRKLRKWQALSWTFEGFQGGWMSPEFVQGMLANRIRFVPQAYTGDMQDMAEDQVMVDLLDRGIPYNVISLFYDAAELPIGWDGFAFIDYRLP